jgi:hypothetical protein
MPKTDFAGVRLRDLGAFAVWGMRTDLLRQYEWIGGVEVAGWLVSADPVRALVPIDLAGRSSATKKGCVLPNNLSEVPIHSIAVRRLSKN